MNKNKFTYPIAVLIFTVLVAIVFSQLNYVENEGFSPTDEGVIISQSWRIINGEIPHKDFISIRPAASGYLHAVNFIFPGSLVANARWFVLFQFFAIALVFSGLVFKLLSDKYSNPKIAVFIALLLSGFTLTTLNYNLYPWTTIDAIFWSVLALPLLMYSKKKIPNIIGLIFLSFAALSRQTFILVAAAGFIYVFLNYKGRYLKSIPVILAGAVPFFAYLIMLISNSVVAEFIHQMTGRTEFFQTAVLQFGKKFLLGLSTPLNILCLFVSMLLYFKRKTGLKEMFTNKSYHIVFAMIYVIFAIAHIILYFFSSEIDIHTLPFELFFMLLFLSILHWVLNPESKDLRIISAATLLISWVSAISLGDNTPVFASGILFIMLCGIAADIILKKQARFSKLVKNQYLLSGLAIVIAVSGYFSQEKFNYRDNESARLTNGLNYASAEFGEIKTNPALIAYYSDLKDICDTLPNSKNNTIVFPHNAIFYSVMQTRNPMSLDWLIANEYIGQESRVKSDLENLKKIDKIYFIVDKIDLRFINTGLKPRFYKNDIVYDFIIKNCKELDCDSEFFRVYSL